MLESTGRGEGRLSKKAGIKESIAYPWCWRRRPVLARCAITPPIVLSTCTRGVSLALTTILKIIQMNRQACQDPLSTERDISYVPDE
jgi:hypothetical protein